MRRQSISVEDTTCVESILSTVTGHRSNIFLNGRLQPSIPYLMVTFHVMFPCSSKPHVASASSQLTMA